MAITGFAWERVRALAAPWWCLLLFVFLFLDLQLLRLFAAGNDWAPVWAAGKLAWSEPAKLYDFELISALQAPLIGEVANRPFIYPPTALLLFAPLALLPFKASLAAFIAGTTFLLARFALRAGADWLLLLAAPPVVLAALAGQPSLLLAVLIFAGIASLGTDERRAGIFLALAAVIKPPVLLLAPIALLAGGHWRALAAAAVTGGAAAAASLALFGLQPWLDWLSALPRFQQLFAGFEPLVRNAVTPAAFAGQYGLETGWAAALSALIALPVVVVTFARTCDWRLRLVAMVGGALLIAPYSMNYELALLAPAVAAKRVERFRELAVPLLWGASLMFNVSLIGLVAVYCSLLTSLFRMPASTSDDRGMQRRVQVPT